MEEELYRHLGRIQQIDRILEAPISSLLALACDKETNGKLKLKPSLGFPLWVAEGAKPRAGQFRTTSCLCFSTLQRIWRIRRRMECLKDVDPLKELGARIRARLLPVEESDPGRKFERLVESLSSKTFGPLNALTAAQVFRVLLQAGEEETHGALGFLAFFLMVWSLERRYPDKLARGASLGPWGPTAYVTAKCLLPIATVSSVCQLRAKYLRRIVTICTELRQTAQRQGDYDHWQFACLCEQLSKTLFALADVSISPSSVRDCAESIQKLLDRVSPRDGWAAGKAVEFWSEIQLKLVNTLKKIGTQNQAVMEEVDEVLAHIERRLLQPLKEHPPDWQNGDSAWRPLAERLQEDWQQWGEDSRYLTDLRQSSSEALAICRRAADELGKVSRTVFGLATDAPTEEGKHDSEALIKALESLEKIYRKTGRIIDEAVTDDARWCRSVMERQIAYVSAGNHTDFDPAELVSAIAVAVRWKQINTPLQVKDAVSKVLEGARDDGSWSPGRPVYPHDDVLGASAVTSDIVLTLVNAISQHPEVDVADQAFFRYIDWLERTRLQVEHDGIIVSGWASDRSPSHKRIDLWATSLAIDALLEIRDLLEFRLWQLAKKRFTVIDEVTSLASVDPVDLGEKHENRLHHRLYRMARETQGDDFAKGEYSMVLYGPPGSSKTKIAEAISSEMWSSSSRWGDRGRPRLLRITPADFTRLGEDRIDFEARLIFDLLRHLRGVTIFFDEIDDLLRKRDSSRRLMFLDLVIPAMLNRLQDLRDSCPRQEICFLVATNYIEKIEPALIRKGRIDVAIPVVYPDIESRTMMIDKHARELANDLPGLDSTRLKALALAFGREGRGVLLDTGGWPWTAIESLLKRVRSAVTREPESMDDEQIASAFKEERAVIGTGFSPPDYGRRRQELLIDANLQREYLAQLWSSGTFTGTDNDMAAGFVTMVLSQLKEKEASDELLSATAKEYVRRKLNLPSDASNPSAAGPPGRDRHD